MRKIVLLFFVFLLQLNCYSAEPAFKLGLLKYRGGGDWYSNPTALPNLIEFCNRNLDMNIAPEHDEVEVGSPEIFAYPFLHMTGHGNVVFSDEEAQNIRKYLMAGGFLHIDDNYGMDPFVRKAMKKVFPELEWVELPYEHPIYHQQYDFPSGPPKIHEHDKKPAQGFALIKEGRMMVYYTYESDLGDGWEDPEVHDDPEEVRMQALQMGANILSFVFKQ